MRPRQIALLFIALLFPICIFIFLKIFGENQFDVPPLFTDAVPFDTLDCRMRYPLPYHLSDSAMEDLDPGSDSLVIVYFGSEADPDVLTRVTERYKDHPVTWKAYDGQKKSILKKCIFLLKEPFDVALVDRNGVIRGQYQSTRRDEVDRLITEIAILIKKY